VILKILQPILGIVLAILTAGFAFMEVVQMFEDKLDYLKDPFNYINVSSAVINFLMIISYTLYIPIIGDGFVNVWAAIGIMFMWLNFLYWMRFFQHTAHFIRMIVSTIEDILPFINIQVIFMGMFGFTLLFLNYDR